MNTIKYILFVSCIVLGFAASAANARWDFVDQYQCDSGDATLQTTVNGVSVSLFFSASTFGGNVKLHDVTCNLATAITWVSMAADDIVDSSAFGDGMESLFSTEYSGASGEMNVGKNVPFFLAFQAYEIIFDIDPVTGQLKRGDAYYGWVELRAMSDGNVELLASAVDIDGDAMIVGGGSATPEPTSGVLLLLGISLLVLRRREPRTSQMRPWPR